MSDPGQLYRQFLNLAFSKPIQLQNFKAIGGGCINNAVKLETNQGDYFLKWNQALHSELFEAEAKGLNLLRNTNEITIPGVEYVGEWENKKFILMEFIPSSKPINNFWEDFGQKLASLHKNYSHTSYGLDHDNFIGRLPQRNYFNDNWMDFFINQRLEFQLKLALENHLIDQPFAKRYRAFYQNLPDLLPESPPSLLHGDLWSGNFLIGNEGKVCLIDSAVYYGHRETELSFTRMFGGFERAFYEAYNEAYPLAPGFEDRIDIYNIYPSMVHVNLFGTSYLAGVERVLKKFL